MDVFDLSYDEHARAKRIVHGSGVTNSHQIRIDDRRFGSRQAVPLSQIDLLPAEEATDKPRPVPIEGRPVRVQEVEDTKIKTSVDKIPLPRFTDEMAKQLAEEFKSTSPEEEAARKSATPEMDQF